LSSVETLINLLAASSVDASSPDKHAKSAPLTVGPAAAAHPACKLTCHAAAARIFLLKVPPLLPHELRRASRAWDARQGGNALPCVT
jgi:hypothetical protein